MRHHKRWTALGVLASVLLAAVLLLTVHPWTSAAVVSFVFDQDNANTLAALEKHAPEGVASITDQHYRPDDDDAYLDVYFPNSIEQSAQQLPTLIWTHGGGWVSGDKTDAGPYFQLIAAEGFTVISLNYSLAPRETYPTPVVQVNEALSYVQQNAERFHVDPDQIMLAGDSAGAQITSQIATMITNPEYAELLGISPALNPNQLRGVVLNCGYYDLELFSTKANNNPIRILRWGTRTIIWA